ncbi:hypothetical protein FGE12_18020 [Aggregicoccus sp. 17bor-14]|uniref:hypothetical protein n=1 Tax=Myxococcaceae TaxID=31 RepID=UPI00129C3FEB|nr:MULTISPECIES: hypothetical protein [Myxococcaceae]MBF5044300.1 hypothetical protein [Simulacricoccus sp. 17bor-14]MRI90049.1 hypothetical protein [Aggregicoccus sp. 17bor-14]
MPYDLQETFGSRLRQAVERRLRRVPYVENLYQLDHQLARGAHVHRLPALSPTMQGIYEELRERGLAQRPLAQLGLPLDATLSAADGYVERLRARTLAPGTAYALIDDDELVQTAEPFAFGLQQPLLDLAERYLGLPVDYLGVNIKREVANGLSVGTRKWHADPEDDRMLKIIVYLSDVDDRSGPFEAVDAPRSDHVRRTLRYTWSSDHKLERLPEVVPEAEWTRCTGPRLTAVFADTARCFHRASPPTGRDRYSMTFSFLSRKAYFCFASGRVLQRSFVSRWAQRLDARQLSTLTPP